MSIVTERTKTLDNLLAAFEGESNASAKYAAFAVKADEDGWRGAASLFRAASRAEQIHADHHARAIRVLGGDAKCNIHPVELNSTLENLKAALAGETYEIDTMYPAFLAEAQRAKQSMAVRTIKYALEAEKTHQRLYGEAIALVEAGKRDAWVAAARNFYVCPTCGFTSESAEGQIRCSICAHPWERFEVIR